MADKGSKEHWMNRADAWDKKLLGKENKTINQIALEMKKDRTSIWRMRNKALNKIMRRLIGGEKNV